MEWDWRGEEYECLWKIILDDFIWLTKKLEKIIYYNIILLSKKDVIYLEYFLWKYVFKINFYEKYRRDIDGRIKKI